MVRDDCIVRLFLRTFIRATQFVEIKHFTSFVFADAERVEPVSINAFRIDRKTHSENAVFSPKFTLWELQTSDLNDIEKFSDVIDY